ncbi:cytochrome c3 family protein [Azospirillum halopraeferens]|uniref:cytochrome c3 family protein n=1 Tax=Azospirillum halopraeferens TaxID=34010 RepID=UPI0003F8DA06|nr:cytochrome c3 family protein [Azospirillum halopraeferens]
MAQVFSRRADTIARTVIAVAVLLAVLAVLRLVGIIPPGAFAGTAAAPPQPRPFSHFHHVAEIGIDCAYCHTGVHRGPVAGFPSVETCAGCHLPVEPRPDLPPPLAWNRVVDMPDHVFFDHSAHVTGGIPCAACHGAVEEMDSTRQAFPLTMAFCLDCHRTEAAARGLPQTALTNCYVCHR